MCWGAFHPCRGQWLFPCGGEGVPLVFLLVCAAFCTGLWGVYGVPAWLSHLATASDGAARPLVCMHGAISTLASCGGLSLSLSPCTRSRACIIPQAAPAGSHHILRASCWQEPASYGVTASLAVVARSGDCGRSRCGCPAAPQLHKQQTAEASPAEVALRSSACGMLDSVGSVPTVAQWFLRQCFGTAAER